MVQTSKIGGSKDSGSTSSDLPGRKLVTSKRPRMLTRSEIELLRQDLSSALKILGQDEIDDAHLLMRERGFHPADFEILQKADPIRPNISPRSGQVVVTRRTHEIVKTYAAGHGSTWLVQLETDLETGGFGHP